MTKVFIASQAKRDFNRIRDRKLKKRVQDVLIKLEQNPRAGKRLEEKLKDKYSLRIWPYRILYKFSEKRDIIITDIGHRKEIYK